MTAAAGTVDHLCLRRAAIHNKCSRQPCPDIGDPKADQVTSAAAVATFDGAQGKVKFFPYAPAGDYRVLYTDYENVVVVYSCDTYLLAKTEYIWVLTRSQEPIEAYIYQGLQVLKEKVPDYDQTQIRRTLHGAVAQCKYLSATEQLLAQ